MRAISVFSFEAGTSSFWWRARMELRRRVRKSATGSVKLIVSPSSPVRSAHQRTCGNVYDRALYARSKFVLRQRRACIAGKRTTSWTLRHQGSHPLAPAGGSTNGIHRTCADKRAGARKACSDCADGWKTLAYRGLLPFLQLLTCLMFLY